MTFKAAVVKAIAPLTLRLSKAVASTGLCSRRIAEQWIASGRVTINGANKITTMSYIVNAQDEIYLDGKPLKAAKFQEAPRLYAVNKLRGEVIVRTETAKTRPLLSDRLELLLKGKLAPTVKGQNSTDVSTLKPVTWLDFQTEGICLMTNNGKLARILNNPDSGMHRNYKVRVHGLITASKLDGLRRGMFIDGIKYKGIDATIERTLNTISWMNLTVKESRPGLIKNIFKALHLTPIRIICTEFGPYSASKYLPDGTEYSQLQIQPHILTLLRSSESK
jgi:23S rRNA pseudouridine2605 synthase